MKIRIRIQGGLIFLTVIALMVFSKIIFPHWKYGWLDELLDAIGISLVLFGFVFRIAARGYKEEKSDNGRRLVTDGPYALIRNPMYFGTLLIGTGVIAVTFALWTLPMFLAVYFFIYIPQIKKEEGVLLQRFGDAYKNYCRIVPAYFPNIYRLSYLREYLYLKFSWIKKEFSSFIAIIAAILALEIWDDIRMFGFGEFYKELLELACIILAFIFIVVFLGIKKTKEEKRG